MAAHGPTAGSLHLVDSRRAASVSFAPPDPVTLGPRGRTPSARAGRGRPGARGDRGARPHLRRAEGRRERLPDPARQGPGPGAARRDAGPDRLLDWLDVKIHSRVDLRDRRRRLRQDDAPRRLLAPDPPPDDLVPDGRGRSRLGRVPLAPRRGRPRARSGVRAAHGRRSCGRSSPAGRLARTRSRRSSRSCRRSPPTARP